MRGLHIAPMTKTSTGGGSTRITVDTREFNMAMRDAEKVIADAMFEGSGVAFARALSKTERYLRGHEFHTPQAKKVADSLDYDKRGDRKARQKGDELILEAKFGSRGPSKRSGEIGFGVHTSPDDDGDTFNIGQAVEEGINAKIFAWRSDGAAEHSRQVGRKGGSSAWYEGKGTGHARFYGITGLGYIKVAADEFDRAIKKAVEDRLRF